MKTSINIIDDRSNVVSHKMNGLGTTVTSDGSL